MDEVGIANESCTPEKQEAEGDAPNAAHHAHLHEVPDEVPDLG
jgi:hypothetical protein